MNKLQSQAVFRNFHCSIGPSWRIFSERLDMLAVGKGDDSIGERSRIANIPPAVECKFLQVSPSMFDEVMNRGGQKHSLSCSAQTG
jgi:hypothetical protein